MVVAYAPFAGSLRAAPAAAPIRPVEPQQVIEVSIYLKDRSGDPLLEQPPQAQAASTDTDAGVRGPMPLAMLPGAAPPRAALRSQRLDECADGFARVAEFASRNGLTVTGQEPARRLIKLSGTAEKLEAAFQTTLHEYGSAGGTFRARTGTLHLPTDLGDSVAAVLGLDQRPIATPKLRPLVDTAALSGFLPNAVGRMYDFPATAKLGNGECIAIIELGGGYLDSDTATACAAMAVPVPKVIAVGVTGGANQPGKDSNADGEVALDIQVAAGNASGAALAVYFAPNTSQGFVDAITAAVHDEHNKPSVISISWGSAEVNWTQQSIDAMSAAFKDAANLGVTVLAASGDNLATDGETDGALHVDFPASSPYVLGCGGTLLRTTGSSASAESVWNSGDSGTGGGISAKFALPAYQSKAGVPDAAANSGGGRGVPDIAGDADPASGYRIVVGGRVGVFGGTSAVAPLWAALVATINAAAGKSIGFVHPLLYGNQAAFNDITTGDNKTGAGGFVADAGWDACTGLGTPRGTALLKLFAPG